MLVTTASFLPISFVCCSSAFQINNLLIPSSLPNAHNEFTLSTALFYSITEKSHASLSKLRIFGDIKYSQALVSITKGASQL